MNNQIERRLDAESASESRGYVGDGRFGRGVDAPNGAATVLKNGPGGWPSPVDVEVPPLASLVDLLDAGSSEER